MNRNFQSLFITKEAKQLVDYYKIHNIYSLTSIANHVLSIKTVWNSMKSLASLNFYIGNLHAFGNVKAASRTVRNEQFITSLYDQGR